MTNSKKFRFENLHVPISLRGSLATSYMEIAEKKELSQAYLSELIRSRNPELTRCFYNGHLIIGLSRDRGLYPPDW
jgi:hypothetical protein